MKEKYNEEELIEFVDNKNVLLLKLHLKNKHR